MFSAFSLRWVDLGNRGEKMSPEATACSPLFQFYGRVVQYLDVEQWWSIDGEHFNAKASG